ncbi:MAG: phage tail family protein [Lachnospiraceae bacterium]|jgi:hypothetical protein|nr:phage tail family protein [Lachnospiraceae bacterium]
MTEVIFFITDTEETKSSLVDYQMNTVSIVNATPKWRKETVEVPFSDGVLDISEAYTGYVVYEPREIECAFTIRVISHADYENKISAIRNDLDGADIQLSTSDEPGYYFSGRVSVESAYDTEEIDQEIIISMEAYPYKYKAAETVIESEITDEGYITCPNERMPVIPRINTDALVTVLFNDTSVALPVGETLVSSFLFMKGDNVIRVTGSANITVTYQEGSL